MVHKRLLAPPGFVTTTRVTHATPAASYAASANRDWECDAKIKAENDAEALFCKDIARQLVEDLPGRELKVSLSLIALCVTDRLSPVKMLTLFSI